MIKWEEVDAVVRYINILVVYNIESSWLLRVKVGRSKYIHTKRIDKLKRHLSSLRASVDRFRQCFDESPATVLSG